MSLKTTHDSKLKSTTNKENNLVRRDRTIKSKGGGGRDNKNTYLINENTESKANDNLKLKSSSSAKLNGVKFTPNFTPTNKAIGIRTGTFKSRETKLNIQKVPSNIVKFTSTSLKTGFNKLAEGKVLKEVKLDTAYQDEIGANTLKTMYNTPITTTKRVKTTINGIEGVSAKLKTVYKTSKDRQLNTKRRSLKDTLKSGAGGISKKGFSSLNKSFKSTILSKADETNDLGANATLTTLTLLQNTLKGGVKGAKGGIRTARKGRIIYSKGKLKTKPTKSKLPNSLQQRINKFKTSPAAKKEIKKTVKKLKDKIIDVSKKIAAIVIKNPFILGIIAVVVTIIFVFMGIVNAILGTHASYFIVVEPNQSKWISSMEKLDKSIVDKTKQYKNVKTVKNSGKEADWKDVMVAYYIKNNNSMALAGATTNLEGDMASVDPETWNKVYAELNSYLGTPYVWGGSDPSTGFDCSGLVQYCYSKYGISLPRTTYEQVLCGIHVERADLKAGDLVFFGTAADVHHVGVYIGNNQYLHAPATGDVVKISDLNGRNDYYEGRRVFQETGSVAPTPNPTPDNNTDKILYQALPNHKDFVDIFYRVGAETGVDPILLASIAQTESSMNPFCVSSAGASGLCQIMPDTFTYLGFNIADIFDPYTNVLACAYEIMDLYRYSCIKSVEDMLTAYNGGIGNFMKYNGPIPGNKENMEYSGKVLGNYSLFSNGQQPDTMQGGFVSGVNTTLVNVYNSFVKLYKRENSEQWILQFYNVEEALNNLGFTKEEKDEFYNFKEYNGDFNEEAQFKDYNIKFKFNI